MVNCKICKDTKQVEELVMGTDTEYVECPYCSDKEEYKKFQEWINKEEIMKVKLYTYKDFLPYFNKEITFEDNRSKCMPEKKTGLIVGLRLDSIEIRVNNNITSWYRFNDTNLIWNLK